MVRKFGIASVSAAVLVLSPAAFAQQARGTAAEAKAMLMKAIAAVKADKAKALDMFNKGQGGFRNGDLYVFCTNASDGTLVAIGNPNLKQALGLDVRTGQNSTGKAFGAEIYAAMQRPEGHITEVSYRGPTPGADCAAGASARLRLRLEPPSRVYRSAHLRGASRPGERGQCALSMGRARQRQREKSTALARHQGGVRW